MNLSQRMKGTEYYEYVNINPKGKHGSDCVIRAIANACEQSWEVTVREMTELGIKKGLILNDKKLYPLYLKEKGFHQMKEPRKSNNTKMSVKEWLCSRDAHLWRNYRIVVSVGSHHVSSIINSKVQDTWNCSDNTMHKWWVRA